MDSLKIINNIKFLLESKKENEAVEIINRNIDILSVYISDILHLFDEYTPMSCLCLSKIYFINQDYNKSIEYAIRASDLFKNDGSFFYKMVIQNMMYKCIEDNNHFCKDFLLNLLIKDTSYSNINMNGIIPLCGFYYLINEYNLFEKTLYLQNINLLKYIIDLADQKDDLERVYTTILNNRSIIKDKAGYYILVDAIYYINRNCKKGNGSISTTNTNSITNTITLKDLIEEIKDPLLKYHVCFYIEETYKVNISIQNDKIMKILSGELKRENFNKFLIEKNLTNFKFLDSITKSRSPYVCTVNAFMNMGTTNDTFYRNNQDIFYNIKEWAKYTDVANLGVIHTCNGYEVLKNFLPSETINKEGGALHALGLINRLRNNINSEVDNELFLYFLDSLDTLTGELCYGACVGLGLVNLGSGLYKDRLCKLSKEDDTIYAESAVFGIGLVCCGTQDFDIINYLSILQEETDFERVKRNISISQALILSCTKHKGLNVINEILQKDVMGGVLSLGTAFVGTGNLDIIQRLLPFLNDSNDDVKRSCCISLGLVFCKDKEMLLKVLEPLAENHNMFIRSTIALVLGFFYSGTGNITVCNILEGLMYDSVSLVRQSGCIGIAFVLQQCNPAIVPSYHRITHKLNKIIIDRSEDQSVKYGATLGRGIMEAGGRNIVFSITNLYGKVTYERLVGCLIFFTSWYWYPNINFISLCMTPTCLLCFDEDLNLIPYVVPYKGNYDNVLIKVPDIKKGRRFRHKHVIEDDIIIKSGDLCSGTRCTLLQKEECNIDISGVYFLKK